MKPKKSPRQDNFTPGQLATIETLRTIVKGRIEAEKARLLHDLDKHDHNARQDILGAMLELGIEYQIELMGEHGAEQYLQSKFQRLKRQLRGQLN